GIPDRILLKPGKLHADERAYMQKHSEIGAEIIVEHDDELLQTARMIALHHHEKWDGSGYQQVLSGDDIPLMARIVAPAVVFDALTIDRTYEPAWPLERAVAFIA